MEENKITHYRQLGYRLKSTFFISIINQDSKKLVCGEILCEAIA
jgi:hypothetical protein